MTWIAAPATGRSAQAGSFGFTTGQTGPPTAIPSIPMRMVTPPPPVPADAPAPPDPAPGTPAGTGGPCSPIKAISPSGVTANAQRCRLMQPDGQSPQPTSIVTA